MGKSCKNCNYYSVNYEYCSAKETNIIDKMGATYCKTYKEKRNLSEGFVKCAYCANLNRYSWCYEKKKCINEIDQEKARKCVKFKSKKKGKYKWHK